MTPVAELEISAAGGLLLLQHQGRQTNPVLQLTRKIPDSEQRIKKVKEYLVCGIAEGGWGNRNCPDMQDVLALCPWPGKQLVLHVHQGFNQESKRSNKLPSGWSPEPWLGMGSLRAAKPRDEFT